MVVGNFNIIIVCANVERDGDIPLYGDIYTEVDDCKSNHPNDEIMFGYYAERIFAGSEDAEETPDWFYDLDEAIDWAETHK